MHSELCVAEIFGTLLCNQLDSDRCRLSFFWSYDSSEQGILHQAARVGRDVEGGGGYLGWGTLVDKKARLWRKKKVSGSVKIKFDDFFSFEFSTKAFYFLNH